MPTQQGRNNKTTIGMSPGPIYRPKSPDRGPAYSIKVTHEQGIQGSIINGEEV